jgi:hypothetical protein
VQNVAASFFQQSMGYTIESSFAAAITDKIHHTISWCVRNACKDNLFADIKGVVFAFTASEARRLKQYRLFINCDFILLLWRQATFTRNIAFRTKE